MLRRVPHIAVVWAHHMNGTTPAQLPESQFDTPMSSPRFTPFPTPTRSRNHVYAFSTNYRSHASQTMLSKSNEPVDGICPDVSSLASGSEMPPTPAGWPFVHSTPSAKGSLCASASHENILPTFPTIGNNVTRPSFTDNDFPPLQGVQDLPVSGLVNQCQPPRTPPKETFVREVAIEAQNERHRSTAKLPTLSSMPKSPESLDTLSTVDLKEESLVTPSFDPQVMFQGKRQDSTVPPTPEFSMPSIAPLTPSTSLSLPDTPHSSLVCSQVVQVADLLGSPAFLDTPKKGGRFGISEENVRREEYVGGDVDPTTIFVGGLNTISDDGWNETKLRTVFEKYGDIKSIQLVKPRKSFGHLVGITVVYFVAQRGKSLHLHSSNTLMLLQVCMQCPERYVVCSQSFDLH